MLDLLDGIKDVVVDHHRAGEFFAAMHHAMADSGDFIHAFQHAVDGIGDGLDDKVYGGFVVGAVLFVMVGLATGDLVHDKRVTDDDPLHHAFRHDFLALPIEELVLD